MAIICLAILVMTNPLAMAKMTIALCGHLRHSYGHLGHGDLFGHVLPRFAMAIAMAIYLAMFYRAWLWPSPWPRFTEAPFICTFKPQKITKCYLNM